MKKTEIPEFDLSIVLLTGRQLIALENQLNCIKEELVNIKNEMINLHYPSPYFNTQQTMEYLGVGRKKLWELEKLGLINSYTIGDTYSHKMKRYKRKELDAVLNKTTWNF